MKEKTIYEHLRDKGLSRRDFMKLCGTIAGMMGLEFSPPVKALGKLAHPTPAEVVARALTTKPKLPIIWLEFQDCAGCSEAISRSSSPSLAKLVLNDIAIEYHETLMAAAGFQAEKAKEECMEKYRGKYVLVVEGSPTVADDGIYCVVAGKSNLDLLKEAAAGAAAVIATGNCASFGGIPGANPNPTRACGVADLIKDKPVINIPGCPAIPEVTTGTILYFLIMGELPKTDHLLRPLTFYGHTIHDHCLRRPFYEAGKFAESFDDEGARKGYCLYKLGCKGP
ncbi:MAG: hydrogenase small subunit, partial [Candidatus Saccharicenans sp.]